MTDDEPLALSVVMPFYRRLGELTRVLAMNEPYLARSDVEVVLVMDDPEDEESVLALVRASSRVKWRVLVNDEAHDWRPPCRALNVGLRGARGDTVLVVSPESAFVGDVPSEILQVMAAEPGCAVCGEVAFASFGALEAHAGDVDAAFAAIRVAEAPIYYGSVAAPRSLFRLVHGYDESLQQWGGDDDNLRARFAIAGAEIFRDEDLKVLHLSAEERGARNPRVKRHTPLELARVTRPNTAIANPAGWGRTFTRVAFDWFRR